MRTTLDIADDVLLAAKETARRDGRSVGAVISALARQSLLRSPAGVGPRAARSPLEKYGIRPLPKRGGIVTNELVRRICDEEGI